MSVFISVCDFDCQSLPTRKIFFSVQTLKNRRTRVYNSDFVWLKYNMPLAKYTIKKL